MLRWWRREPARRAIPDALWEATLATHAFLQLRDDAQRARLRLLAEQFLASKEFTGANGFVVTDAVAVAIAAQAVLPVLHLGLRFYDDFVGIVVHADEVVAQRTVVDEIGVVHDYEEVVAGEAMERGPVMLSWRDVAEGASDVDGARAADGAGDIDGAGAADGVKNSKGAGAIARAYNVVIHEFAHKIDMRDGASDGCPPLPSRRHRAAWLAVLEPAYAAFRERVIVAERFGGEPTWLDPYGAQAIDEFFAVACEAYFVNRARFGAEFPEVAVLFDGFFRPGGEAVLPLPPRGRGSG